MRSSRANLKDLDLFVLDNTLRESVVVQARGQTLQDKRDMFKEVLELGFQDIILGAFAL